MASDNPEGIMASDKEESMARCLWNKFRNESILALHTPFVVALASGSLKHVTFRNFISQELHFLKCYIQTFELAAECLDDDCAKMSINSLIEELKKRDSLFKTWGFPWVEADPATVTYTELLLATASGKIDDAKLTTPFEKTKVAVYTLGALMPHLRIYAFIGKELQSVLNARGSSHPYKKWINYYSSEKFQDSTLQAMALLDKLSVPLTGKDRDIIQNLYHQAMEHELDFFSTQPIVQKTVVHSVVPLFKEHNPSKHHFLVMSDFDVACTVVDSFAIFEEIAIERALESQNQIARIPLAELRNKWLLLSMDYVREHEQCIQSILKSEYEITTEDSEITLNRRVIESGVLKGLNLEDIKRASERLIPQDGCINFFQSITKNENISASIHVISYCWCDDLIKSFFSSGDLQDTLDIHSNKLIYDEKSISTGGMVIKVECPNDKVKCFEYIRKKSSVNGRRKKLIVYIGDSLGDLLCLLKADIGIVIGTSEGLREVGSRFGISFVPLFHAFVKKQKGKVRCRLSGILYTASCWAEIQHSLITGL